MLDNLTTRLTKIVQNLRNFARGSGDAVPSDLHAGIEETLMLLMPRLPLIGEQGWSEDDA